MNRLSLMTMETMVSAIISHCLQTQIVMNLVTCTNVTRTRLAPGIEKVCLALKTLFCDDFLSDCGLSAAYAVKAVADRYKGLSNKLKQFDNACFDKETKQTCIESTI